ncbi:hypothetical protein [Brevibacterium luteolum]|uniref:hypothetical protein n=1 Tax=Brevibacterium luteolum TaxID=199591 RepID=UPI00223AAFB3|nr:hypothetical protein [Brevibacterium luteolum]MCT1829716.1 hypothetical protein [Brevibacterium luteolum]
MARWDRGRGLSEIQHFFIGETLRWRIPIGTTEPIKAGAKLVLEPGDNWTFNDPSTVEEQTGVEWAGSSPQMYLFHRFYGGTGSDFLFHDPGTNENPRFNNVPTEMPTYELVDGKLVVTLPEMPADSHIMFTATATPNEGTDINTTGFAIDGKFTGEYPEEVLERRGCLEPTPTDEPTATDDPTATDEPTATDKPTDEPRPTPPGDDNGDDNGRDDDGRDDNGRDRDRDGRYLPRTGAGVGSALFGAALLIGGGAAVVIAARRRR